MLINMRLNRRSSLFTDKDSFHRHLYIITENKPVYRHGLGLGQISSGNAWGSATLVAVAVRVSTLAISPQVTTALDGVVLSRGTLGTEALLAL